MCSDIHHKRGELEKRQIAVSCSSTSGFFVTQQGSMLYIISLPQIKAIGQTELNTSNPEEVLQLAAQKRKKRFLQAMAKLYF